jgi:hypothetical protein
MGFLSKLPKPKLMFQVLHARVSHNYHLTLGTTTLTPTARRHSSPTTPTRNAEKSEEANGRAD